MPRHHSHLNLAAALGLMAILTATVSPSLRVGLEVEARSNGGRPGLLGGGWTGRECPWEGDRDDWAAGTKRDQYVPASLMLSKMQAILYQNQASEQFTLLSAYWRNCRRVMQPCGPP